MSSHIRGDSSRDALRERWTFLYRTRLPSLARAKHDSQPTWPVTLDHCFARIILDNTVGSSQDGTIVRPWNTVVASPAIHNLTEAQLSAAIALAEKVETGEAHLVELDRKSLEGRGKGSMSSRKGYNSFPKRSRDEQLPHLEAPTKKRATRKGEMADIWASFRNSSDDSKPLSSTPTPQDKTLGDADALAVLHHKIRTAPALTPYRKHVLLLLTQVPRGRYTTYKALAAAAARHTKAPASARAVGSAMRNNPFAPAAPCHRVLAADGRIGGFKGERMAVGAKSAGSEEGAFVREKRAMLKDEGVRFDGAGRVVGEPFVDFR